MNPQSPIQSSFRVGPTSDPDRYALGMAVASGAEGIVYCGSITTGTGLELAVAIKMLQPRFLDRVDEWNERWTEQVELLRSLQVPGVVPVRDGFIGPLPHGLGERGQGRTLYLVMNWIEGEPIDEWVRHRQERDPLDDLKVLVQIAAALDLMHSGRVTGGVPVIHRDVKPSNILITDGGAVLVDFGLTRGLPTGHRLTGITGTPGYLAPEVVEEGRYSPASDRYALGAVAYFIVTGIEPPSNDPPEVLRDLLRAAPTIAGRPDVVDHLMEMLDDDPSRRPSGLANWIGQLRNSSLQPGPEPLSPPAPRRDAHEPPGGRESHQRGRRAPRLRAKVLSGLAAALIAGAVLTTVDLLSSTPARPNHVAGESTGSAPSHFVGSFDPKCGHGQDVPVLGGPPLGTPAAFAAARSESIIGYNDGPLGPQLSQSALLSFGSNCSPNQGFVAATDDDSGDKVFSMTALAIADNGKSIYAAGFDEAGWVTVKYQSSGALDPTFGNGGFVIHPEAGSGTGRPTQGAPAGIVVTASGVYVVGVDGGSHASSRTLIVALRPNGSVDSRFNAATTKGILVTGVGSGSGDQVMTATSAGDLLVGGTYEGMGCGLFTADEYRPTGDPVPSFHPLSFSGTGTTCGGTPLIPGAQAVEVTSLIALEGGKFAAIGAAYPSLSAQIAGTGAAFIARFDADGSIDRTFGNGGSVTLPGLVEPPTGIGLLTPASGALGAVAQPSGGFLLASLQGSGPSLTYIGPDGRLGRRVQIPSSSKPTEIATGDAGGGRIEILIFSSSQWDVARYLGVN